MNNPTTLGDYRAIAVALFGKDSRATAFLDDKIAEQGVNMKVIAHETQMFYLLRELHFGEEEAEDGD